MCASYGNLFNVRFVRCFSFCLTNLLDRKLTRFCITVLHVRPFWIFKRRRHGVHILYMYEVSLTRLRLVRNLNTFQAVLKSKICYAKVFPRIAPNLVTVADGWVKERSAPLLRRAGLASLLFLASSESGTRRYRITAKNNFIILFSPNKGSLIHGVKFNPSPSFVSLPVTSTFNLID